MHTSISFRSKLLNPCKLLFQTFKFRFKISIFKRASRFRNLRRRTTARRNRISSLLPFFRSSKRLKEMDELGELRTAPETARAHALFPSPITPAYVKIAGAQHREVTGPGDVENACRSFENYLVEMIVEEGKVRDLMDVEELLYCWKNLRSPVFIELVSRFYGELCKDLFSGEEDEEEKIDDSN